MTKQSLILMGENPGQTAWLNYYFSAKLITLTPKGEELCKHTVDRLIYVEQNALSRLMDIEQRMFLDLYQTYIDGLRAELNVIKDDIK